MYCIKAAISESMFSLDAFWMISSRFVLFTKTAR